jgi:glutamyl-tRNA synthetase
LYEQAAARLREEKLLYPCFESVQELEAKRDQRVKRGKPAVYDRAMLKMTEDQRARAEAGGKVPYWRFLLAEVGVRWEDVCLGSTSEKMTAISDPVLVSRDGTPSAALASAVDDMQDGITHLIRGAEQVAGTAVQLDILRALGGDPGRLTIAHIPPLAEGMGKRAKRPEGLSIKQLRADGMEPAAIRQFLGTLGRGPVADWVAEMDLAAFAPARFEIGLLLAANRAVLAGQEFETVSGRLPAGATLAFWAAVRGHLDLLPEARGWWDVVAGEIVPPEMGEEAEMLRSAASLLPGEPWHASVWPEWRDAVAQASGRRAPEVAPLLRLALTGEDFGPDLAALLPLMGRERARRRLELASC